MLTCQLLIAASLTAAPADFKKVKSADGDFQVQVPGGRVQKMNRSAPTPVGKVNIKLLLHTGAGGVYIAASSQIPMLPKQVPPAMARQTLVGAQQGMLRQVKGKLKSSKAISLKKGKYPGREIVAEANRAGQTMKIRARLYLVGNVMYQMQVIGKESWINAKGADAFLDSFKLLKE